MDRERPIDASDKAPKVEDAEAYIEQLNLSPSELAILVRNLQQRSKTPEPPQGRPLSLHGFSGDEKVGPFGMPLGFAKVLSDEFSERVRQTAASRQWDTTKSFAYDELGNILQEAANKLVQHAKRRFPKYGGLHELKDAGAIRVSNADIEYFKSSPEERIDLMYQRFPSGCVVVDDSGKDVARIGWEQIVHSELFFVLNHAQSSYHRIVTRNSPKVSVLELAALASGTTPERVRQLRSEADLVTSLRQGVEHGVLAVRK